MRSLHLLTFGAVLLLSLSSASAVKPMRTAGQFPGFTIGYEGVPWQVKELWRIAEVSPTPYSQAIKKTPHGYIVIDRLSHLYVREKRAVRRKNGMVVIAELKPDARGEMKIDNAFDWTKKGFRTLPTSEVARLNEALQKAQLQSLYPSDLLQIRTVKDHLFDEATAGSMSSKGVTNAKGFPSSGDAPSFVAPDPSVPHKDVLHVLFPYRSGGYLHAQIVDGDAKSIERRYGRRRRKRQQLTIDEYKNAVNQGETTAHLLQLMDAYH